MTEKNVIILDDEKKKHEAIKEFFKEALGIEPTDETLKTITNGDSQISFKTETLESFQSRILENYFGDNIPDEKDIKPIKMEKRKRD